MRRFFGLRSSTSSSESVTAVSPAQNDKKGEDRFRSCSQSPQSSGVLKPRNRCSENESSPKLRLRRSLSFSSAAGFRSLEEENLNFLSDRSTSPSNCDETLKHQRECPLHSEAPMLEKIQKKKSGDYTSIPTRLHEFEDFSSSRSPITLGSKAGHPTSCSNKIDFVDLYIDTEHHALRHKQDPENHTFSMENDNFMVANTLSHSRRPPRVQYMGLSSFYGKENLRSHSFRETNDTDCQHSCQVWIKDDLKLASGCEPMRRYTSSLTHEIPRKTRNPGDYGSLTLSSTENVNEDSSDAQASIHSDSVYEMNVSGITSPYKNVKVTLTNESSNIDGQKYLLESVTGNEIEYDHDTDEQLLGKVKQVEDNLLVMSDEFPELLNCRTNSSNMTVMLQMIKKMNEDRKSLALDLSLQLKSRLLERHAAKERIKQSKVELDTRTRRLEKEKRELQFCLEKELDKRSSDWSIQLEKFLHEEQWLRERGRELAEQNVSLQRETTTLKTKEAEAQSRMLNSERQISDMETNIEEARKECHILQQNLLELQKQLNGAEKDRDFLRRSYKELDKEKKELQQVIVRMQRTCNEQEKTISALRQGYKVDLHKDMDGCSELKDLQREQLRLTGVEMTLRREVESCRNEMKALRCDNISLLNRLQGDGNEYGSSIARLHHELSVQVDYLRTLGLSILDDQNIFCSDLLKTIKSKEGEHCLVSSDTFDGYSTSSYVQKYHSLTKGIKNLRRSLEAVSSVLNEEHNVESHTLDDERQSQSNGQTSETELECNLRAEALLSKVLKEMLCSRELELERLQADLASSIRENNVFQSTNQNLQDEISCLSHNKIDMENEIIQKDEKISQLQQEMQAIKEEANCLRDTLQTVTMEKDMLTEEQKSLRRCILFKDNEMISLRKKIEALDEDILIKEGQISILKDSVDKSFNTVYRL